jgi:hypothetical protein
MTNPTLPTEKPGNRKKRTAMIVLGALIIAIFAIIGTAYVSTVDLADGKKDNTKNSSDLTPASELTQEEAEQVTVKTAEAMTDILYNELAEQLTEEEMAGIVFRNELIQEDPETGEPTYVALLHIKNIPGTWDIQTTAANLLKILGDTSETEDGQKIPEWKVKFQDAATLGIEDNGGLIQYIETWEKGDDPHNPSHVRIDFYEGFDTPGTYEVTIQSKLID